jgi:cobalt-zinc-cadmium efflux system protein
MAAAHDHGHGHDHASSHGAGGRAPLATALVLTSGVALLEFVGGLRSGSLALLTDSAHVLMDVVALGISLFAAAQMRRPANDRQTYGYARFETLAALVNGVLLFGITAVVAVEAVRRFSAPELPQGGAMAAFAAAGLAVNVAIGLMLLRGAHGDLNVKAALYHVAGDALGAFSVALGGLVVAATHATWIDPAVALFVALIIVVGVVGIVREAAFVLLQSAPAQAAVPLVRARLCALPGVVDVHDLHVWTIGGGSHVLTAHVLLADKRISEASDILREIEIRANDEFGIDHVTVQFECERCQPEERIVCVRDERDPNPRASAF